MKKKLQVFISSTFIDLIEERQSAVEAVLSSGHIPAGMELFKAGDESQKETIKKWINESDVYVLILGGRYGSIEPMSGKSYTHWEYDYAGEVGIPRFAIVINEHALDVKVKQLGTDAIEIHNSSKYEEFKKVVLSKTSEFFQDNKDIKLTIHRKLAELGTDEKLAGWVSAKDTKTSEILINEIARLTQENIGLRNTIKKLEKEKLSKNKGKSHIPPSTLSITDFRSRIERTLLVMGAEEQEENEPVTWLIDEKEEVCIPEPRSEFKPYFKLDGENNIEEIMLIGIVRQSYMNEGDALAEIRVMLSEQKNHQKDLCESNITVKFIIAVTGEQPKYVEYADEFFKSALESANVDKSIYKLEVWDEVHLGEIERSMCLKL
jgi:hypothetical protein